MTVSIIGCGWLGLPLAEELLRSGYIVKGSATSAEKVALLREKGIDAHQLQLMPEPIGGLDTLLATDTLIINVPPKVGKFGDEHHPQQMQHVAEAIKQSALQHVIYISTTSVYPELSRELTEIDVTTEADSAAPALVRAEQRLLALSSRQRTVTVLRCGGLMGYDRIPGKYVAGRTVDSGAVPVNYIHRDDAIGLLGTLLKQRPQGVFNAVAPLHPLRAAIYRKSCADFGYELPTFVEPPEPMPFKIVSPQKVLQQTNYTFRYADPLIFFYENLQLSK